ncbi:hypothetical protein [Marinicella sp. W31]|uniref:hypothetical protein n=1 Tax=Marinicella sp. W31 TaxID=3023713 RepID=UPI00375749AF
MGSKKEKPILNLAVDIRFKSSWLILEPIVLMIAVAPCHTINVLTLTLHFGNTLNYKYKNWNVHGEIVNDCYSSISLPFFCSFQSQKPAARYGFDGQASGLAIARQLAFHRYIAFLLLLLSVV